MTSFLRPAGASSRYWISSWPLFCAGLCMDWIVSRTDNCCTRHCARPVWKYHTIYWWKWNEI